VSETPETLVVLQRTRHGDGSRAHLVYGELRDAATGDLLMSATLDHMLLACALRRWRIVPESKS
jgi:hypothetical protein